MGVSSETLTQYLIGCDICGDSVCCPSSRVEGVHSKQQAIKWANMHKIKNGKILCNVCFNELKRR